MGTYFYIFYKKVKNTAQDHQDRDFLSDMQYLQYIHRAGEMSWFSCIFSLPICFHSPSKIKLWSLTIIVIQHCTFSMTNNSIVDIGNDFIGVLRNDNGMTCSCIILLMKHLLLGNDDDPDACTGKQCSPKCHEQNRGITLTPPAPSSKLASIVSEHTDSTTSYHSKSPELSIFPRIGPVFRAHHGSRIRCMSVITKLITKITTGGTLCAWMSASPMTLNC